MNSLRAGIVSYQSEQYRSSTFKIFFLMEVCMGKMSLTSASIECTTGNGIT